MADADMRVEWHTIQAFSDYEISSEGGVRRRIADRRCWRAYPAGYVLSQWKTKNIHKSKDGKSTDYGRMMVTLQQEGKHSLIVARLVCEAFHGQPPSQDHQAAHNNGNRLDNRSKNLRWATGKENQADRIVHGTDLRGSRSPMSKLQERDVIAIIAKAKSGESDKAIAAAFRISKSNVKKIRRGVSWLHVQRDLIRIERRYGKGRNVPQVDRNT